MNKEINKEPAELRIISLRFNEYSMVTLSLAEINYFKVNKYIIPI